MWVFHSMSHNQNLVVEWSTPKSRYRTEKCGGAPFLAGIVPCYFLIALIWILALMVFERMRKLPRIKSHEAFMSFAFSPPKESTRNE